MRRDYGRIRTRIVPDGCQVALRTALVCPFSMVILVVSARFMSFTSGSLEQREHGSAMALDGLEVP